MQMLRHLQPTARPLPAVQLQLALRSLLAVQPPYAVQHLPAARPLPALRLLPAAQPSLPFSTRLLLGLCLLSRTCLLLSPACYLSPDIFPSCPLRALLHGLLSGPSPQPAAHHSPTGGTCVTYLSVSPTSQYQVRPPCCSTPACCSPAGRGSPPLLPCIRDGKSLQNSTRKIVILKN